MIIVFDFDHTLFDMMAMHEALGAAIGKLGVNRDQYDDAYLAVTHWKMFTPQALAQRLHKAYGTNMQAALDAMQGVAARSREFLYPDAAEALRRLKEAGHEIYILTRGDEDWQRMKVKHSGLAPYCVEAFCLAQAKQEFLREWCIKHPGAVMVDDRPVEIKAVHDLKLPIRLVRMRRPDAKYADQDTPPTVEEIRNLEELFGLLENK